MFHSLSTQLGRHGFAIKQCIGISRTNLRDCRESFGEACLLLRTCIHTYIVLGLRILLLLEGSG